MYSAARHQPIYSEDDSATIAFLIYNPSRVHPARGHGHHAGAGGDRSTFIQKHAMYVRARCARLALTDLIEVGRIRSSKSITDFGINFASVIPLDLPTYPLTLSGLAIYKLEYKTSTPFTSPRALGACLPSTSDESLGLGCGVSASIADPSRCSRAASPSISRSSVPFGERLLS